MESYLFSVGMCKEDILYKCEVTELLGMSMLVEKQRRKCRCFLKYDVFYLECQMPQGYLLVTAL